jgi:ribosome biogenesis GTPase
MLPNGGLVIDTPGLRELQLWGTEDDLDSLFADVEVLTKQCRFSNCAHKSEPDCAILSAVKSGDLDEARLESYFKFQDELRYLSTKVDENAALERNQSFKKSQKNFNQMIRGKKEI